MTVLEPEFITIVEGPTPEFRPTPQLWLNAIHEGPGSKAIALCQLRTLKGEGIMQRCLRAWDEKRPVKLDFPDAMRMRQQVDVVAMRLQQLEEGPLLLLWVSVEDSETEEEEEGE